MSYFLDESNFDKLDYNMCKWVIIIISALYVQASYDISRQSFGNDTTIQYLEEQNPDQKDDEIKTNINKRHLLSITLPIIGGILILLIFLYYLTRPGGRCCRLFDEELPQPCPETCIGLCKTEIIATLNQLTEVPLKCHIPLPGDHTEPPLQYNVASHPLLEAKRFSRVPLSDRCCCQQETPTSPLKHNIQSRPLLQAKGFSRVSLSDRCCCQQETPTSPLQHNIPSGPILHINPTSSLLQATIPSPVPSSSRCCCQQETLESPSPEVPTSKGKSGESLKKAKKQPKAKSKLKKPKINPQTKIKKGTMKKP